MKATTTSSTYQSKQSINSANKSTVKLTTYSETRHTSIWEEMKCSAHVGTCDHRSRLSWRPRGLRIMESCKCTGDTRWSKHFLRTGQWCIGEMMRRISKSHKTISYNFGVLKLMLREVIFLFYSVLGNATSKIILSPSDYLYINLGIGNIWFNTSAGSYHVWKQIYQGFQLFPQGVNKSRIIGAEVALWGEVSNDDLLENDIWMRATAMAERLWTDQTQTIKELVKKLVTVQN